MELLHIRAGAFLPLIFKGSATEMGNRFAPIGQLSTDI